MNDKDYFLEQYEDYCIARTHLIISVLNYSVHKKIFSDIPFRMAADLAVTCHMMEKGEDGKISSAVIDRKIMQHYDITEEQLFSDAFSFAPRNLPPVIRSMEKVLEGIFHPEEEPVIFLPFEEQVTKISLRDDMPVLTNTVGIHGAAVLFYPHVLEMIGEKMKGSFFILPSSVHETILLADDGLYRLPDLEQMVREINRTEIPPKDRLSDEVYYYDASERLFGKASSIRHVTKKAGW